MVALLAVSGCGGAGGGPADAQSAGMAEDRVSVPGSLRDFRSPRRAPGVPEPRRLRIPALGVDTTLERLGQRRDQTVEVPRDWQRAGWYHRGPAPGELGSAVILGHVDSPSGPAVFTGLAGLRRGARILVERSDGSMVTFRVTRIATYPRANFPVQEVYLPTLHRELRLITCGGAYVRSRGGYQDNVVVFAGRGRVDG